MFENSYRITLNPSIRYTIWSIIIGGGFNATAVYSCLQTQAQRYLCVKNTRSAQKYFICLFFDKNFFSLILELLGLIF